MKSSNTKQIGENAKVAFSELTSFLKNDKKDSEGDTETNPHIEREVETHAAKNNSNPAVQIPTEVKNPTSLISVNTKITGDISTQGDLEISGRVEGNVNVKGKLTVIGAVEGDIEAEKLMVKKGTVVSQMIKIKSKVEVEDGSDVCGNIQCEDAVINAKITGNILVIQKCELAAASVIQGDITAKEFSVQSGAKLSGKINIASEAGVKKQKDDQTDKAIANTI